MNRFGIFFMALAISAVFSAASAQAQEILTYNETYSPSGTIDGTDVEGLENATFEIELLTTSTVYTMPFGLASVDAGPASVTISGSTNPANNGTFIATNPTILFPNANFGLGPQSLIIDGTGFDPSFTLPSGNVLFLARTGYAPISGPLAGVGVLATDFSSGVTNTFPAAVAIAPGGGGANLWQGGISIGGATRIVTAIPEPSTMALLGFAGLGLIARRRRES